MLEIFYSWYKKYFSQPETVVLLSFILILLFLFHVFGQMLAPLLVSLVVSYLLDWFIEFFHVRLRIPRVISVLLVFAVFMGLVVWFLLSLFPLLWQQSSSLLNTLPGMQTQAKQFFADLATKYPRYVSPDLFENILQALKEQSVSLGQKLLTISLSTIPNLFYAAIYLFLVPLLVLFMLLDRNRLIGWFKNKMPEQSSLIIKVWHEVHEGIGNYIRGKGIEAVIVSIATYIGFYIFNMDYAILLSVGTGLSCLFPYIGAVFITIPVILVVLFTWGFASTSVYVLLTYALIQLLDGNVLAPLLFSEAVSIHPIAIIIAVLVFGGIWGFWGVFLAVPLAVAVKAIITTWPVTKDG